MQFVGILQDIVRKCNWNYFILRTDIHILTGTYQISEKGISIFYYSYRLQMTFFYHILKSVWIYTKLFFNNKC